MTEGQISRETYEQQEKKIGWLGSFEIISYGRKQVIMLNM